MNLSTPIEEIPRVGPAYQKKLKKLGVKTVGQLIFHFPHRYEDFSNLIPIAKAEQGGPFSIQGKIADIKIFRAFRRKMMLTQATLEDETGKIKVLWFNQPYLANTLKKGTFVCLAGKIKGAGSAKYLSSPSYEKILNYESGIKNNELKHTGRLIPVYPETEGLSSRWLRFIVKPLLLKLKNQIPDSLPERIRKKYDFLPLQKALWQIHFPDSLKEAEAAKKRFAFEELFVLSLFVLRERLKLAKEKAISISLNAELMKEFTENLPFKLTDSQKKAAWQILKDLEKPRPMNRLLEGDVGSGKTVVAAMAALSAVKTGNQAAFMAPTEILAKQHYKTFGWLLKKFNLNIGLITGKESYIGNKKVARKELLKELSGEIDPVRNSPPKMPSGRASAGVISNGVDILIGTHAVIQDPPGPERKIPGIKFRNLVLAIIDEQHRFGVEQRAKLLTNSYQLKTAQKIIPHFLSMTATPIPRTLSLTVFGDLDLSLIDELPKGRKKIITKIVQPKDKQKTYNFIREQVKEGRQVFVICPRIDPPKTERSDIPEEIGSQNTLSWYDVKAVKQEYKKLSEQIFPDLKVGILHGKMKTKEKEEAMKNFKAKSIDILVSTSVVEVGVDVPNASVMLIEGSEKFGLAQLHQFRGRVGRADHQSYCFLFTDSPGIVFNKRLKALISCENGFELAEKDLAIRGPGDFIGQRQWGIPDLAMASLADISLIQKARQEAKEILSESPDLKKYPILRQKLEEFEKRAHLE